MNKSLKILQLAPRFPFPMDDGGKIGIGNIFIQFAHFGCAVHFFCFKDETIDEIHITEAKKYGDVTIYPHIPKNTLHGALFSFLTNKSLYINKHYSFGVIKFLNELCKKERFDVIHCDHTAMAKIGLEVAQTFNIPVGLRLHNIEHLIWERYSEQIDKLNPLKFFAKQQAMALKKAEIELISKCDVCFPITQEEKEYAAALAPDANLVLSSIGVNTDKFTYVEASKRESKTLVIATTYKWRPNVEGLLWFIENVMPILKNEVSGVKLILYGKGLPEIFQNYSHLGVCPVGYVEDIVPHLQRATLYVAPLFVGAGIRVKILEAMATGLPVVATSIAANGINAGKAQGLVVSDDAKETAQIIKTLLCNNQMRSILGKAASEFVRNYYSWEKNVRIMLNEYVKLVEMKRQIKT